MRSRVESSLFIVVTMEQKKKKKKKSHIRIFRGHKVEKYVDIWSHLFIL